MAYRFDKESKKVKIPDWVFRLISVVIFAVVIVLVALNMIYNGIQGNF